MGCPKITYRPTLELQKSAILEELTTKKTNEGVRSCFPFGSQMGGRSFSSNQYKYGFNGMEKDDELKGSGNSYDFGARIYDSRLGRFLSVDSKTDETPWISPYVFAANNPIRLVDHLGKNPDDVIEMSLEALDIKLGYSIRYDRVTEKTVITKIEYEWNALTNPSTDDGNGVKYTIIKTDYYLNASGELEAAQQTRQEVDAKMEVGLFSNKLTKNSVSEEVSVPEFIPVNKKEEANVVNNDKLVKTISNKIKKDGPEILKDKKDEKTIGKYRVSTMDDKAETGSGIGEIIVNFILGKIFKALPVPSIDLPDNKTKRDVYFVPKEESGAAVEVIKKTNSKSKK